MRPLLTVALLFVVAAPVAAGDDLTVLKADGDNLAPRMLRAHLLADAQKAFDARRAAVAPLKTPDDVQKRQKELRAKFVAALGGFPEKTPLNARVVGTEARLRADGPPRTRGPGRVRPWARFPQAAARGDGALGAPLAAEGRGGGKEDSALFHSPIINNSRCPFFLLGAFSFSDAGDLHVRFDERGWRRSTAGRVRHRQTKGPATAGPRLNHRATPRLYFLPLRGSRRGAAGRPLPLTLRRTAMEPTESTLPAEFLAVSCGGGRAWPVALQHSAVSL
jgi:hypothetical protein